MFESKALIEYFAFISTQKAAPHSPRRQKLNLRMKSLSLDSPESTELHGRGRRYPPSTSGYPHHGGSGGQLEHSTPPSNNSRLHCKFLEIIQITLFIIMKLFLQHLRVRQHKGNFYTPIAA
jgi:hypothetical protein